MKCEDAVVEKYTYHYAEEAISDLLCDSDDDSDWEEMGGIDPALAPNHDWDHDPVGFR